MDVQERRPTSTEDLRSTPAAREDARLRMRPLDMTRRRPSSSNNNARATSASHSTCSWPAQTSRKSASEQFDGKQRGGPGVIRVHISRADGREGEPRRERFPHPHRLARVIPPPTVTYSCSRSKTVSWQVDLVRPTALASPIPHQVGHRFVPLIAATPPCSSSSSFLSFPSSSRGHGPSQRWPSV